MGYLFSCVIPVIGARPYFKDALASIEKQGIDVEVIVQDGDIERDLGQSDALNRGFAKAHGDWLFWLNADDVLLPGALQRIDPLLKYERWISGNMVTLDSNGLLISCLWDRGRECDYRRHPVRVYGPSSFFHKSIFDRTGGFDVSLKYCMDTDLWCRFRDMGVWYKKIDAYLWGFRLHSYSKTAGNKSLEEQRRQDEEVALMHSKRGVSMSLSDTRKIRLKRLLNGSYLKGAIDTFHMRGKHWSEL